ncbi:MAG: ATP-binding protein [bacterium]
MSSQLETELQRLQEEVNSLRESFNEITAIQASTEKISTAQNVSEIIDEFLDRMGAVISYKAFKVYLKDPKQQNKLVFFKELISQKQEYKEVDPAIVMWAANRHQLTFLPQQAGSGSIIVVPLVVQSKISGVVLAYVSFSEKEFTQQNHTIISILTGHTAIALENRAICSELLEKAATLANMKNYVDFVLQSIMHGIVTINKTGEVTVFNKRAEEILMLRASLIVGNNFQIVFPQKLKETFEYLMEQTLKNDQVIDHEIILPKERKNVTVSISTTIIRDRPDNIIGVTAICRDMSLSREILRLRELDKLKNNFISMVSHELRTPMASIMACAETLRDGVIKKSKEKQEFYDIIFEQSDRLNNIINDVLDLSKIESGKLKFTFRPCRVNQIIDNCISNNRQLIAKNKLSIEKLLDQTIPEISADKDKITQVVVNILSNAIKFTPQGGKIIIKSGYDKNRKEVHVSIRDTGIGIAKENFSMVFDKFVQIEESRHHSKGTGLGMPISKELVEGHKGRIWLESELNKGTVFHFTLPFKPDN